MKKIKLLDCTLRDGSYITGSVFGDAAIRGIIGKLENAGVEIIECGWLKNDDYKKGTTYFHVPDDLIQYIGVKDPAKTYVTMIDWDRYDLDYLPVCDGRSIDAIRVVFPHGKSAEGVKVASRIKEKGYKVYLQAANTLAYSEDDLKKLAGEVNELKPEALSVVDTFGAMYPEDLERITETLDRYLNKEIGLGFHSHNNQQLSFALSMEFAKLLSKTDRECVIDASLCGMGRGAGNTTTELLASFLNKKYHGHYNLDAIMDAIDTYMEYYKEKYSWGYSTPYFIAGLYCCHVNNIAYLLNNHRTNAKDMRNIIESLSEDDRKKYDYDLLEEKYLKNKSYEIDDSEAVDNLKNAFSDRKVLLVAPGKSSLDCIDSVREFISKENPIVIGVNSILDGYEYDYNMFVNNVRYEYAKNAHADTFASNKKIVLSNVEYGKDDIVINFRSVIKRGWKYYDNAMICALRLMERLNVKDVYISGFDGFKHQYNLSYADEHLPSLNPGNTWDELNEEIKAMYRDFIDSNKTGMKCVFLTDSIFNK